MKAGVTGLYSGAVPTAVLMSRCGAGDSREEGGFPLLAGPRILLLPQSFHEAFRATSVGDAGPATVAHVRSQ